MTISCHLKYMIVATQLATINLTNEAVRISYIPFFPELTKHPEIMKSAERRDKA